jgi:hypothetical protein
MLVAFAATLATGLALTVTSIGPAAEEAGRGAYGYRAVYEREFAPRTGDRPLVAWLGDSTMLSIGRAEYPAVVGRLLARDGVDPETRVVAGHLLDFYSFYFLAGPVLDLRPDLLVLMAHLRLFHRRPLTIEGIRISFNDLASFLPTDELPTALGLPLHERGLSVPTLLLARLLRFETGERALYLGEGLRHLAQQALDRAHVADTPPAAPDLRVRWELAALGDYDATISRREPVVRMMEATVRMAVRRGVPTVVIGSPIPSAALAAHALWNADADAERFRTLAQAVTDAGGRFVDLHLALAPDEFSDMAGHYTPAGIDHMARLLVPIVRAAVERGAHAGDVRRHDDAAGR